MAGAASSGAISTVSLYAAAIAIVSGGYSLLASTGGMTTAAGTWVMAVVGLVALVHGVVLLTPAASRLGGWSGPLMIAYAVVMLLNRAFLPMGTAMDPSRMGGGMGPGTMGGGGFGGMMGGFGGTMGVGSGMVALALLMLVSGLIMTVRSDGMRGA